MTVTAPEKTRTDERLDDISEKVDGGFAQVDKRFERVEKRMDDGFAKADADICELRGDMKAGFDKVDAKMDAGFAKFDAKFDRLMWWLLGFAVSIILALLSLSGTLIATHVL